jgi:hypothetical protein
MDRRRYSRVVGMSIVAAFSLFSFSVEAAESLPLNAKTLSKESARVKVGKECAQELEYKNKLKAGIREANLAHFPIAAIEVSKDVHLIAEQYWTKRWSDFTARMRVRSERAHATWKHEATDEGFDGRVDLAAYCEAVAARSSSGCGAFSTVEGRYCLLQVQSLTRSCQKGGLYYEACRVFSNPAGPSCESQGGPPQDCALVQKVWTSLEAWCGDPSSPTPTPRCLGSMVSRAQLFGTKACDERPDLAGFKNLCRAMLAGDSPGCTRAMQGFKEGSPARATKESAELRSIVDGRLMATDDGQPALLIWASTSKPALCHVVTTVKGTGRRTFKPVQQMVRVLDRDSTQGTELTLLDKTIDPFTSQLQVEATCIARSWW